MVFYTTHDEVKNAVRHECKKFLNKHVTSSMVLGLLTGTSGHCHCYTNMDSRIRAVLQDVLPVYFDSNARVAKLVLEQEERLAKKFEEQASRLSKKLTDVAEDAIQRVIQNPNYDEVNRRFFDRVEAKALAIHDEHARQIASQLSSARWQSFSCGFLGGIAGFGVCVGALLIRNAKFQ
jgi:hypothetical protein